MSRVAHGKRVFTTDERTEGQVRYFTSPQDVMAALGNENLDETIALVRAGTCSFAAPLLSRGVAGVLTMEGDPQSHLGILSREYGIPAIMNLSPSDESSIESEAGTDAYFSEIGEQLDNKRVELDCNPDKDQGTVHTPT